MKTNEDNTAEATTLFNTILEEVLDGNDYQADTPEAYKACMNTLEDGEYLGQYFADIIPQRDDYEDSDDYDEARAEFERSDEGLRLQRIAEEAHTMAQDAYDKAI